MKKIILLSCIIISSITTNAQNSVWAKNDRQNVMDEGISLLSKSENISKDKKEIIGKCYMDFITTTYKLEQYKNLIDYELKTLQKTTITKCAKDIGFDISEPKEESKKLETVTKENIVGHWKDDECEFWLRENGNYEMNYFSGGKTAKGTWTVGNNQLNLYKDKFIGKSEKLFKILIFTEDKFVYQSLKKKADTFTATRIK